ncbi:MAG TPA: class I SAM-dependent methyltransferase [Spirochaetota bacterium]|nr:class I SAM-dependent methyltransferase [Spirochaetota bacterium]
MNSESSNCPICRISSDLHVSNNLYKCRRCSLIFNADCKSLSYDRDYFISEYQGQYGKTYLEDFDNIYRLSGMRLEKILKLLETGKSDLSVLDIGSAAGFFLKAAKDKGIKKLKGIEISNFASDYCRKTFSIEVIESSFESAELNEKFDIITSWFFIEHLIDPLNAMKRIYQMLNDGGVFALAVPSCFGPMFYFDKDEWIKTHPKDHRIDLSPKGSKKILKDIGFKKVKIIKCGYHPERVVNRKNFFFKPFEFFYRLYSSITGFSDTIEIYAMK